MYSKHLVGWRGDHSVTLHPMAGEFPIARSHCATPGGTLAVWGQNMETGWCFNLLSSLHPLSGMVQLDNWLTFWGGWNPSRYSWCTQYHQTPKGLRKKVNQKTEITTNKTKKKRWYTNYNWKNTDSFWVVLITNTKRTWGKPVHSLRSPRGFRRGNEAPRRTFGCSLRVSRRPRRFTDGILKGLW